MATKKTGPTLAELNSQIAVLQAKAEALRTKELADVVDRIREAIDHYGLTASDLGLGDSKSKVATKSARKVTAKSAQKSSSKKPARKTKFSDGHGNTWSGMGKRPNWFRAALESGKKPEELLVSASA